MIKPCFVWIGKLWIWLITSKSAFNLELHHLCHKVVPVIYQHTSYCETSEKSETMDYCSNFWLVFTKSLEINREIGVRIFYDLISFRVIKTNPIINGLHIGSVLEPGQVTIIWTNLPNSIWNLYIVQLVMVWSRINFYDYKGYTTNGLKMKIIYLKRS